MNFIDLFSGIGGMGHGLKMSGMTCIGFCEIDKYAHAAFNLIHNKDKKIWEGFDIRNATDDDIRNIERERGKVSVIAAGFPCQSFSIAGQRKGFGDTRGTLIYEVFRFASILKPKYLLLENVKGLLNHEKGETFRVILESLDELGYDAEWQVLNSKNFGVPQNRERLYIIANIRGTSGRKVFPIRGENNSTIEVVGRVNVNGHDLLKRVYSISGISPTLDSSCGGNREPKVLIKVNGKNAIRKITPLEYFRLQSFPDNWYHELKNKYSNTQIHKMAGNAVTSNIAYEIGKKIIKSEEMNNENYGGCSNSSIC